MTPFSLFVFWQLWPVINTILVLVPVPFCAIWLMGMHRHSPQNYKVVILAFKIWDICKGTGAILFFVMRRTNRFQWRPKAHKQLRYSINGKENEDPHVYMSFSEKKRRKRSVQKKRDRIYTQIYGGSWLEFLDSLPSHLPSSFTTTYNTVSRSVQYLQLLYRDKPLDLHTSYSKIPFSFLRDFLFLRDNLSLSLFSKGKERQDKESSSSVCIFAIISSHAWKAWKLNRPNFFLKQRLHSRANQETTSYPNPTYNNNHII